MTPYQKMLEQSFARDKRIRDLKRLNYSVIRIARLHGISRQRVYKILERMNGK